MSLKPASSSEYRGGIADRKGSRKGLFGRTSNSTGLMDPTTEELPDLERNASAHLPAANQNATRDPSQRGRGQGAPAPAGAHTAPTLKFEAEAIKAAHLAGV